MKRLTFCIFALLFYSSLLAQEINSYFEHYSYERGLSNPKITAITRDKSGMLWVGTADGVNRFDGFRFKQFLKFDVSERNDTYISALYVDKDNNVWIGTKRGEVWLYNQHSAKFKKIVLQLHVGYQVRENVRQVEFPEWESMSITAIQGDAEGKIYIGSRDAGLFILHNSSGSKQTHLFLNADEPGIPDNFVTAIAVQNSGRIFVACYSYGIIQLVYNASAKDFSRSFSVFPIWFGKKGELGGAKHITALHISASNNLYAGDLYGRMYKMLYGENKVEQIGGFSKGNVSLSPNEYNRVYSIQTISEKVFYSTGNSGICSIEGSENKVNTVALVDGRDYRKISALPQVMYLDDYHNVWLTADNHSGLYRLRLNSDRLIPLQQEMRKITAVVHLHGDNFAYASNGRGLFIYNTRKKTNLEIRGSSEKITDMLKTASILFKDKKGQLWIGTTNGEILVLSENNSLVQEVPILHSSQVNTKGNAVTAIEEDSTGVIWAASAGKGLLLIGNAVNHEISAQFNHSSVYPNTIPNDDVKRIMVTESDIIINCRGNLFARFIRNTHEFEEFVFTGLPSSDFQLVKQFRVWFAYFRNGKYYRLDFIQKKAAPDTLICGYPDWLAVNIDTPFITTADGLYTSQVNNAIRKLDISSGAVNLFANTGNQIGRSNNAVIIGTSDGLFEFQFGWMPVSKANISMVSVDDRQIFTHNDKLYIESAPSKITLVFTSDDLGSAETVRFAYRFANQPWQYVPNLTNSVDIPGLSPGIHKFQYCMLGGGNKMFDAIRTFTIIVEPPIWRKSIFWGLAVILLIIIFGTLYLMKLRHVKMIERLQRGLAADLHDNIGAGLTEIALLTEVVKLNSAIPKPAADKISIIGARAAELVDSMSDIVWLINPKKLQFDEIILRLKRSFVPVCESRQINLNFTYPNAIIHQEMKAAILQNMYLFMKEAVNNAIKHANASEINVSVGFSKRTLSMSIADNGSGFDIKSVRFGNGLRTMHDRAENLGGELQIKKSAVGGTEISCIFSI